MKNVKASAEDLAQGSDGAGHLAEADERRILATYQSMYAEHGAAAGSLGSRASSQPVRFGAVLSHFGSRPPESLLDLGCGFADLLPFLRAAGWTGRYVGLDLMPEFVETARERYRDDPAADFVAGHLLTGELPNESYDWSVALGVCNHQRDAGAGAFIEALIARAVAVTRRTVLVDFLSETSDKRRDDLFFTSPADAISIGLRHSRRVVLDHSYMPFEFMLKIRLDDEVAPGLPYFAEAV